MSRLTLRKKVHEPADRMWETISGLQKRPGPNSMREGVKGQFAIEKASGILGAAVRWAKGQGYRVSLSDVSMPIKRSKLDVSVRHAGKGESEVTVTMDYAMKYGPLGSLMNLALMRPLMRRSFSGIVDELAGLSRACGASCTPSRREGRLMEAKTDFAGVI